MKKLRLNNIFHWLYAILMFLPFILLFGYIAIAAFNPSFVISEDGLSYDLLFAFQRFTPVYFFQDGILHEVDDVLNNVFWNIIGDDADFTLIYPVVRDLFIYWVELSLVWLCFDVLMFFINLAHRWIDRGTDL